VAQKSSVRLLFLFGGILLLAGCDGSPDPPRWDKVVDKGGPQDPVASQLSNPSMMVYLDVSGSMKGYVAPDGLTVFGRVLHELRQFTTTFDSRLEVRTRRVGGSLGKPESDLLLVTSAKDPQLFNEGDTDLVGALRAMAASDHPARYNILVTDGVMSTRKDPSKGCATGSDQVCVRREIVKLLDDIVVDGKPVRKGWGGCILGIRSQFKGSVYSEIKPLRGESPVVPYKSDENAPTSYRPFYLFIFSPDVESLDGFVEELKERIQPIIGSDNLRELALTLPYTGGGTSAEIVIPKESQDFLSRTSTFNDDPLAPPQLTLRVSKDAIDNNQQQFKLNVTMPWSKHALATGSPEELPKLVDWEVQPVYPLDRGRGGVRYPKVTLSTSGSYSPGVATLPLTVYWPRAIGEPEWIGLRIVGGLALDRAAPTWVHEWSTDDDSSTDVGNRTFDLESAVLNLWRNDVLKKQRVATVYLRIGPE